jgi:hypothetical protein
MPFLLDVQQKINDLHQKITNHALIDEFEL